MLVALKLTISLLLLIFSFQLIFSAAIPTDKINVYSSSDDGKLFEPKIGVYMKSGLGRIIKTYGGAEGDYVTLPKLSVDTFLWEGKSLVLECWSDTHPVYWEYRGLGDPGVRINTVRKATNFTDPSTYSYGAIITISETRYTQTGEYMCNPTNSYSPGHSIFVFAPGKRIFVARSEDDVDDAGVSKIIPKENSPWVTLPCAPSQQDAIVELYSMNATTKLRTRVPISDNLKYDIVEGFRLKWRGMGAVKRPWGDYVCVGRTNKIREEFFYMSLKSPQATSVNRFATMGSLQGSSRSRLSLQFNAEKKQVECCSSSTNKGNAILPRMKLSSCISVSDCLFTSSRLSSLSSQCPSGQGDCTSDPFIKTVNGSCVAYELPEVREAGLLQCLVGQSNYEGAKEEEEMRLQFSYEPSLKFVTNFDPQVTETSDILGIGREELGNRKDPNEAIYFCKPNSFFFSQGLKWAVQRRGKGQSDLQFLSSEDGRSSVTVNERDVSKVYCFAPIWNSLTEWRNVSMVVPPPTRS